MADNKYQIQLGVDLDTSDLSTKISKLDNKYDVKLGVDLKVNDIRDRITQYNKNSNNAKLKLGIKLDTSDLKEQIKNLSIDGKDAKGVSLPLNTTSLETSLRELKEVIAEIKSSFNSLDGGDMKSLLSSVNQIVTALGKAEDESDSLVKSLSALSKKDFSINLGIDMNKKGLNTIGYGRAARKQVIPELESQIKYLENLFGGQQAAMSRLLSQGKNVNFDVFTGFDDFNSDSAIKKMEAMEKYINALKKLASIDNINLDGFNEIHKDASNLINDITGIENAVDKAGDVPEKIKNLFGGSVDGENLTRQLDSVVANLGEIKTAIQGLSSGISIDGLTQSFDRLSDTIEKLVQNCTTAKKAINDSLGNAGSSVGTGNGIENLESNIEQITSSIKVVEPVVESLKKSLNELGVNSYGVDAVTKDIQELGIEVSKVETKVNGNNLKLSITGLKETEDGIKRVVKEVITLENAIGNPDNISRTITDSFKTSADKAKADIKETNEAYKQMLEVQKRIRSLLTQSVNLDESKNVNELKELDSEFQRLTADYETLKRTFNSKLEPIQLGNLQAEMDETDAIVDRLNARLTDMRNNFAKQIKFELEDTGAKGLEYRIENIRKESERFVGTSGELREAINRVDTAFDALNTANKANETRALADAYDELKRAIELANSQLTKSKKNESIANKDLNLGYDIKIFQSKIDAWLTKNSAAAKDFGASMLDLRARAEGVDRVKLGHLEKEFKELDYAADKAGKKMMSFGDQIKTKFKEYMAYFSVAEVFQWVEQGLREMFNTVKEIDTAMTGLYRVTDLTAAQYDTLFNDMISSAKEYGATLNDIINATTDWVRAGFDANTSLGLAEVTTMYQHISDLDYDTAAENLITAYNGFKDELNTAFDGDTVGAVNYIADVFNELDNNFAVTSAGLGEALTRSASALDLAGNTIQETAG